MDHLDAPTLQEANSSEEHAAALACSLTLPCRFDDYELLEEIARGGMGIVFKARQIDLNRIVAMKMILDGHFADQADVKRFRAEAEAAANLDHPSIVPVYEVGNYEGRHFFSMAFVDGETLTERLNAGPMDATEAARFLAPIADAIHYAHQQGVIHRDLKPGNILIDRKQLPRVSDFGVAKTPTDSGLTVQGQLVGTPSYMPPEQALGKLDEVTEKSDVYSLGAILYAMVTGRPPFQSANQLDTLHQVVHEQVVPPRRLNSQIPRDMETITLKCLEKLPAMRYGSAGALAEDLRRLVAGERISARPPGLHRRASVWFRDHIMLAGMSGLTTLVLVAGLAGLAYRCRMEMDQCSVLAGEISTIKEDASQESLRADMADMKRKQMDITWRYADSERLALWSEKLARRKETVLAILLAVKACERLHEAGLDWNEKPAVICLRKLIHSDSQDMAELLSLAKTRVGRELTEEEYNQYIHPARRE